MAQFGYSYRSISTYNNGVRNTETGGSVAKPYAPFVPKLKKIIPVGSSRKAYYDDEDERDDAHPRHTSPHKFDDFIAKVHNEATRSPPRSTHLTSSPYNNGYATNNPIPKHHHANKDDDAYAHYSPRSPIAAAVNHDGYVKKDHYGHGYGDYNNKDGPKPTSSPVYNTGYGGDYNSREGPKPKPKPTASPVYNTGYGGDYNSREGPKPKPTGSPVYNSGYGGDYNSREVPKPKPGSPIYNSGYGGDYNSREGPKPKPGSPVYNSGYGGDYNSIEGPKPKPKTTASPVYNSGYGDDYGNFNNREGPRTTGNPVGYGGDYNSREGPKTNYNTGYSGDYNSREGPRPKPTGIPVNKNGYGGYGSGSGSPTRYGNYDHDNDYDDHSNYHNKKKGSSWSDSPRKGTQLSKATNNIEEAMEMLMKEAAMRNGPKPYEYDNKPAHRDGSRPAPASTYDRTMNLVNETERLKNIVTGGGAPQTQRPKGNLMPQRFNFNDGNRSQGHDEYGVINHKEAEKKFNGVTLDHNQLYAQDY